MTHRGLAGLVVLCVFAIGACGNSRPPAPHVVQPPRHTHVPGAAYRLPGDADGIAWDAASATLYVTDGTDGTLWSWTDRGGFARVSSLPHTGHMQLAGLVRLTDGSLVTTSFGFGSDGAVLHVAGDRVETLPGLDPARRRLGLALADGALYDAYFIAGGGKRAGGVARVGIEGGETDVVTAGLSKPVGLAAAPDGLYISDQDQRAIFALHLGAGAAGALVPVARDLPDVDLLAVLPDGDLVTGGRRGTVYRVTRDGHVSSIATGFEQVRGLAYDPNGKRLFVIEHSVSTSTHWLHVLPLAG